MKVGHRIIVALLLSLISTGGSCCNCYGNSTFCEAAAGYRQSGIDILLVRGMKVGEIPVHQHRTDMILGSRNRLSIGWD